MSELMHAIVLLAHFHSLASFVFGCGVTSETDHPDGHVYTATTDEYNDEHSDVEHDTAVNGHASISAEVSHRLFCVRPVYITCSFSAIIFTYS